MHSITEFGTNIPAFLTKLWRMVEDPSTNDLIQWNSNGSSFIINDQAKFARELLPMYYKHNNMPSFVRQLNMYGFHKIASPDAGCAKFEQDETEFHHPCFLKDQPFLLEHIKRKITLTKTVGDSTVTNGNHTEVVNKVLTDVRQMRSRQESMDSKLSQMKLENEALWRELAMLRQKHIKQQQIVNKLIQFLISLVQHPHKTNGISVKRRAFPLMLQDRTRRHKSPVLSKPGQKTTEISEMVTSPTGPVIHELDSNEYATMLLDDVEKDDDYSISPNSEFITEALTPEATTEIEPLDVLAQVESPAEDTNDRDNTRLINFPTHFLAETSNADVNLTSSKPLVWNIPKAPSKTPNRRLQMIGKAKRRNPQKLSTVSKPNTSVKSIPMQDNSGLDMDESFPLSIEAVIDAANTQVLDDLSAKSLDNAVLESAVGLENLTDAAESSSADLSNPTDSLMFDPADVPDATATAAAPSFSLLSSLKPKRKEPMARPSTSTGTKRMNSTLPPNAKKLKPSIATKESKPPEKNKDMTVACKAPLLSKQTSVDKEEMDVHLDVMQSELESLKDLLKGEGLTLDANTLLGLFSNEDVLSYTMDLPQEENKVKENGNELMTYSSPSVVTDFSDIFPDSEWILPEAGEPCEGGTSENEYVLPELETPDITLNTPMPSFPASSKKKFK